MRTISNVTKVILDYKRSELSGNLIPVSSVSEKLREYEELNNLPYKELRQKFYNSFRAGKYNCGSITTFLVGIDIENPMKKRASLDISFKEVI